MQERPSFTRNLRKIAALSGLVALCACSLPRGAALHSEITRHKADGSSAFQVVEVSKDTIDKITSWPATGGDRYFHWPKTGHGGNTAIIRVGDLVDVTVWDNQENSLLTTPGQRFTRIDSVEIGADGTVFLPYLDKVEIAGLTADQARSRIQDKLAPIAPAAQVQLALKQGRTHAVDVVGGVARPGAYPMPSRNYKVLNVIADAGGIPKDLRNPRVRLIRGSQSYEISADLLMKDGARDALLRPNDRLVVEEDKRAFTALGASGTEALIYFPKDRLSALEALSLMGGLVDHRADPEGVLILREYDKKHLRSDQSGPEKSQVVFSFDLTRADGLFAARKFQVQPGDTVLATQSPVTNARTIIGLIGAGLGIGAQAVNVGQ